MMFTWHGGQGGGIDACIMATHVGPGVLVVEQSISGMIQTTSYFYARDYRDMSKMVSVFNAVMAVLMVLCFGWW